MGSNPSKRRDQVPVEELERLYPEPNYEVKTRQPMESKKKDKEAEIFIFIERIIYLNITHSKINF